MKQSMLAALLVMLCGFAFNVAAQSDVNFSGTLVKEPCVLDPKDSAINLDFGTVINKMLYSHTRTNGLPFALHLQDCDLSLGDNVVLTFNGAEDLEQPGLLAFDATSTASGVALGIETVDNLPLPINKPLEKIKLTPGSNQIDLMVYISASAEAIKNKSIMPGNVSALMSFGLEYE
jgi:type 1 fimbria pilin